MATPTPARSLPAMGDPFHLSLLRTPRGRFRVSLPPGGEFLLGTPEPLSRPGAAGESGDLGEAAGGDRSFPQLQEGGEVSRAPGFYSQVGGRGTQDSWVPFMPCALREVSQGDAVYPCPRFCCHRPAESGSFNSSGAGASPGENCPWELLPPAPATGPGVGADPVMNQGRSHRTRGWGETVF